MSLIRSSSRKQFSITPQDLASCLDQKNSMISLLQTEVQNLRFNHQKYQMIQQDLSKAKQKYESTLRNYVNFLIIQEIQRTSNQERLDLSAKNCAQMKIQVDYLNKQLQSKTQQLKEVKRQTQHIVEHNGKRQDEAAQCLVRGQELKAANDLLKIEQDRVKSQIIIAKEEIERQIKQNTNINKSLQTIKDKCYKTQSYIRNLARQQATLNQSLAKIEDQNNYLDIHISQLAQIHSIAEQKLAQMDKDNQQKKFIISSKQLELRKIQKQIKQAAKTLLQQKQKTKLFNEQLQQKKHTLNRLQGQVKQCSEQINFIMARNVEVTQVNIQLKNDLKVCQKHWDNVIRINKNIEGQLGKFKEVNLLAIKKLQQPLNESQISYYSKQTTRKFSQTARMTATGGFDVKFSS